MNNIIKKIAVNLRNSWIGFLHLFLPYLSVYCWVGCWWKSNICSEQILSTPSCARKKCCVPGWPLAPRPRVATHSLYCNGVIAWKVCIQINAQPLVSKQRVNNKRMKRKRWEFSPLLSNQWDIYASFCAIIRLCHALTEKRTSCIGFRQKPVHFRVKKRFLLE